MNKMIFTDTKTILSHAYATIFELPTDADSLKGDYDSQHAGDSLIDYADFRTDTHHGDEINFDYDNDFFEAVVEDGSEGCWIRVDLVRYNTSTREYIRFTVGTIKTLDEGVNAWRNMGALAGELAYLANYKSAYAVRKMVREQAQNA